MTLRTAVFDADGNSSQLKELDTRVCDCCQTSMTKTSKGVLVVYRDRSEEEIRDISIVRNDGNRWTEPTALHTDNWKISGCPVNGPVIRSRQDIVAAAWYTEADFQSKVKLVISQDGGSIFSDPIAIDHGNPMGRVAIQFVDDENLMISWVEAVGEDGAEIIIKKINAESGEGIEIARQKISPSRSSGFPKIAQLHSDKLLLAWTAVNEKETKVVSRIIKY